MNIALVGRAGSGKTTLANILVERGGYTRKSLADPIKGITAEILAYAMEIALDTPVMAQDVGLDAQKETFRPILQWLGTEFFREHLGLQDIWVRWLLDDIKTITTPIVVDDVRFPNEASALRDRGFLIVGLERLDNPTSSDHVSEAGPAGILCDEHYNYIGFNVLDSVATELLNRGEVTLTSTEVTTLHDAINALAAGLGTLPRENAVLAKLGLPFCSYT